MASVLRSVEHLLDEVKQLPPANFRVFARRLAEWTRRSRRSPEHEKGLIEAATCRLPQTDEKRLCRLIVRSENGTLTQKELNEYRALAKRAEKLNAIRLQALIELARLHGKSVSEVIEATGWEDAGNEA